MEKITIAKQLLHTLESAVRQGTEKDEPEGSRYIQITISDTLALQFQKKLKEFIAHLEKNG